MGGGIASTGVGDSCKADGAGRTRTAWPNYVGRMVS